MPEWSNGAVSKTVVPSRAPGVRIPFSPQYTENPQAKRLGDFYLSGSDESLLSGGDGQIKAILHDCAIGIFCVLLVLPIGKTNKVSNPDGDHGSNPPYVVKKLPF